MRRRPTARALRHKTTSNASCSKLHLQRRMNHARRTQRALPVTRSGVTVLPRRRDIRPVSLASDVVDREVPAGECPPQMTHITHTKIRSRISINSIAVSIVSRAAAYMSNVDVDRKIRQRRNPIVQQYAAHHFCKPENLPALI